MKAKSRSPFVKPTVILMIRKMTEVGKLKEGSFIIIDGEPCRINNFLTSPSGKHGPGNAKITSTGLFDSQKHHIIQPTSAKIEVPIIERGIDLEAVLRPGLYRHVRPGPNLLGWKVDSYMVMQMRKLRERGLTYGRIAGELGLSSATVRKYVKEI